MALIQRGGLFKTLRVWDDIMNSNDNRPQNDYFSKSFNDFLMVFSLGNQLFKIKRGRSVLGNQELLW